MKSQMANEPEKKHFRVVHFVNQFPVGEMRVVLRDGLDFEEAKTVANNEIEGTTSEAMVVEDMQDPQFKYIVKEVGTGLGPKS